MSFAFDRPVGAVADVKELEYISALHQTVMPDIRKNGAIYANDIAMFLESRFRIVISQDKVREIILQGIGGGDDEEECLDLMEIMALLLIPALRKAADEVLIHEKDKTTNFEYKPIPNLLQHVTNVILHDVTDSLEPKRLDADLLAEIFRSYGEKDMAEDTSLLNEMIEMAKSTDDKDVEDPTLVLNVESFARGLTNDVLRYKLDGEFQTKTVYEEIFSDVNKDEPKPKRNRFTALCCKCLSFEWLTAPVDSLAETARSTNILMLAWALFILTFFVINLLDPIVGDNQCPKYTGDNVGEYVTCLLIDNIAVWTVKCLVSGFLGFSFVLYPSIGNYNSKVRYPVFPLLGLAFTFALSRIEFPLGEDRAIDFILVLGDIVFYCIIILHAVHILNFFTKKQWRTRHPMVNNLLEAESVKLEVQMKRSAAQKMNRMLTNAVEISKSTEGSDNVMDTYFGQSLLGFAKYGDKEEKSGGFMWTFKSFFNGKLYEEEGLWISGKIRANWMTMLIIAIFIAWTSISFTVVTVQNLKKEDIEIGLQARIDTMIGNLAELALDFIGPANTTSEALGMASIMTAFVSQSAVNANISCPDVSSPFSCEDSCSLFDTDFVCSLASTQAAEPQLALLQAAGLDVDSLVQNVIDSARHAIKEGVDKLYPSNARLMIAMPLIVFNVVSFLVALLLAIIYFPSVITTTLMLRSGVIPTFRNPRFSNYRKSPDNVSTLSGNIFWGTVVSSLLLGGIFGIIAFILVYQVTRPLVLRLVTIVIGISITITAKTLFLMCYRKYTFRGFYRRKPGRSAAVSVFLDAVDFSLSIYFTLVRLAKIILIGFLYVGRIDTPLFAPGVPVAADPVPSVFVKDILSHDAHRHPLLSLMGTIYVMKLTHKDEFVNRAGSAWRLLFVFALFPWLATYRLDWKTLDNEEGEKEKPVLDLTKFKILRSDYSGAKKNV